VFSFFLFALVPIGLGTTQSRWHGMPSPGTTPSRISYISRATAAFLAIGIGFLAVLPFYLASVPGEQRRGVLGLDASALGTIFGSFLGLGTGPGLLVLALFGLVGLAVALHRWKSTAIFGLIWISIPFLFATHHAGGVRLLASPRYLLFLIPVLLPFIASGGLTIGELIAALVLRYRKDAFAAAIANKAAFALPCLILFGLVTPELIALYNHNPKLLPVDMRSAYSYLLARAQPQDVILEVGEPQTWNIGWFHFTDSYFLRPQVAPRGMRPIPLRAEPRPPQPGSVPFQQIDAASGKLFVVIVCGRNKESSLRQAAGDAFVASCWGQVCVVESGSSIPMHLRLDDFLKRFSFIDPPGFVALLQFHRDAVSKPEQSAPAQH
jgi:hypothetical protein